MFRVLFCVFLFSNAMAFWACSRENPTGPPSPAPDSSLPPDARPTCQFASECSCNEICNNHTCQALSCQNNGDCRCGWKCVMNQCYSPAKAPCSSNADCTEPPNLWKCDKTQKVCINGGCRNNSDCKSPSAPTCNLNTNRCAACTQSSQCDDPQKPLCQRGRCVAEPGVEPGGECQTRTCQIGLVCHQEPNQKKICRKPCSALGEEKDCPEDTVCSPVDSQTQPKGLCLEPGSGVAEGGLCSDSKPCQRHLLCAFEGNAETCRRLCRNDSNCSPGEQCLPHSNKPTLSRCMPKPLPCGLGRDCPGQKDGYHLCINGQCQLQQCPKRWQCLPTQKCTSSGRCVPRQCPKDPCAPLFTCKNNRCTPTHEGKPCGPGTPIPTNDCGKNLVCAQVGYRYSCVRSCHAGQACPAGMQCEANTNGKKICIQPCPAPKPCRYSNYGCIVLKNKPTGHFCAPNGQPSGAELFEPCSAGNACLPHLRCESSQRTNRGYCSKPCKSLADCQGKTNAVCATYSGTAGCYILCSTSGLCTPPGGGQGFCYAATRGGTRVYICRPL